MASCLSSVGHGALAVVPEQQHRLPSVTLPKAAAPGSAGTVFQKLVSPSFRVQLSSNGLMRAPSFQDATGHYQVPSASLQL